MHTISILLDSEVVQHLEDIAIDRNSSSEEIVVGLIEEYIEQM